MITVIRAGPLTTVQDLGRPGYAHLGVPRSGAMDGPAARLANELVGNSPSAAVLETTLMGCALRFAEPARVAVTGAAAVVRMDGDVAATVLDVPAGSVLDIGRTTAGVRSYVAVRGGVDVEPVLGSRSTDTLSGLGPPALVDSMTLPIGTPAGGASPPAAASGRGRKRRPGVTPGANSSSRYGSGRGMTGSGWRSSSTRRTRSARSATGSARASPDRP